MEDRECKFKNLNRYDKIFEKAQIYVKRKYVVDKISEYIMKNINNKTVDEKGFCKLWLCK